MTARLWSTTATNNNSSPPAGAPEGMAPSAVNNVMRQIMADARDTFEQLPFFDFGDTPTRTGNTTFTVSTDLTARYVASRRVKLVGATTGYASISSSSYSAPNTTVTVVMDSGNVPTSLSTVSLGPDLTGSVATEGIIYKQTPAESAASVTPTNYFIPSHDAVGFIDPARYGLSTAASSSTNGTALANARAVSAQAGADVRIGGGTYNVLPSAQIQLASNWSGAGKTATTINVDASYASIVFLITAHTKLENLQVKMNTLAKTAGSIGVRFANPTISQFQVYMTLEKVIIQGFDKNIDYQNVTMVTLIDVQSNSGNFGEYCNPDTSGGNGFVTTVTHINCDILQNDQNVNFIPTINSSEVIYIGGAIEDSTGAKPQAVFGNIQTLRFFGGFAEGNTGQNLFSCTGVSNLIIDGFTNNAGPISISDVSTVAHLKGIVATASTATVNSAGTNNVLTIENCQLPSSGNALGSASVTIINSTINGITYRFTSLGTNRIDEQKTVISGAGVTDIYRFLSGGGAASNGSYNGLLTITAKDHSTGANQAVYRYTVQTTANGATGTTFTQDVKTLRGTDPGVAANPCTLIADGVSGAAKITFQKNGAIAQVDVTATFNGQVI